jgi:hypothetical protein
MPKTNIFPLYLTGAVQAATTTASWNGTSSVVTCNTDLGAFSFTVGDATILGATLYIRKTNVGNDLTITANGGTIATLSNQNDTAQLIWNGDDWVLIALSDIPAALAVTSLNASGNLTVSGTASVGTNLLVTGTASFATGNFVLGVTAVAQQTGRTAAVTINSKAGIITTNSAASGTAAIAFTVNNSFATLNSVVLLTPSGVNASPSTYRVSSMGSGSFQITYTMAADTATATAFNYLIVN